jgi:hypothetical protein
MLKTDIFEFRDGKITFFVKPTVTVFPDVFKQCVAHARMQKKRKPYQYREVPTLTRG